MSQASMGASLHARQKYLPKPAVPQRMAICLAGAGMRAAGYLLGCARRLNEVGLLSKANSISAVGGGAVVAGQLARFWPVLRADAGGTFVNFDEVIADPIERFTRRGPRLGNPALQRLRPRHWSKASKRDFGSGDLLADELDRQLYRGAELRQLTRAPIFWFCGINLTTNGAWYYRADRVGELLLGFTARHRIRLGEAVAASAASPLEFPPVVHRFAAKDFEGSLLGPKVAGLHDRVHILSGMLNDPLALEPVWRSHSVVVVCDAGQLMLAAPAYNDWLGNRILRSLLASQAAMAEARKRSFLLQLLGGSLAGAYIGLSAYHGHYGLSGSSGYPSDIVGELERMRTTMSPLSAEEHMALSNHGYTLADTAIRRYLPGLQVESAAILPFPSFVDRAKILGAMQGQERESLVGRHAA